MKAAVIYGKQDVRVEDVAEPVVTKGRVKVKVAWAGICGSDLHAYHHGSGLPETPHPLTGKKLPLILGHEFAGVVSEVGEDVECIAVGDRVSVEPLLFDRNDYYVKQGKYNLATQFGFMGLQDDGGFAQYVTASADMVHKLPDHVTMEEGALVEPTAVAMQAVKQSQLKVGQTVVVFGAGPIGLLTIIAAKAAGASEVFAVDLSQERLEKALEVGADVVINSGNENAEETILAMTEVGVDVAYEAAGVEQTFASALQVLKKGGQLMVIAAYAKPITVNMTLVLVKEIKITASLGYSHIFPDVIALIASGKIDVKKVITKKITLDHLVEEGLELLVRDKSHAKILINIKE